MLTCFDSALANRKCVSLKKLNAHIRDRSSWSNGHLTLLCSKQAPSILQWIGAITATGSKQQHRYYAGVILFFWWELWKECSKRMIFENKESYLQVAQLIKNSVSITVRFFFFLSSQTDFGKWVTGESCFERNILL